MGESKDLCEAWLSYSRGLAIVIGDAETRLLLAEAHIMDELMEGIVQYAEKSVH